VTTVDAALDAVMRAMHVRHGPAVAALRELPPQTDMAKPRDRAPIEVLRETQWHCRYCEDLEHRPLTIQWHSVMSSVGRQSLGRCRECGQQYVVQED